MLDEFKSKLTNFAIEALKRVEYAKRSEAATRQYLILPFLQVLGYDPHNPDEIMPEEDASFSEKFKNKVDFVILKDCIPVIAIETKTATKINENNRGELKGYFNAKSSVKLGILTDGLTYELFTDTGLENMMDDQPFAVFDLNEFAEGHVDENALDAIIKLRKNVFDPADVGADAKRKIFVSCYTNTIADLLQNPADDFIRLLMDRVPVEGKKTAKAVSEHTPIIHEAIQHFFDKMILDRVGFATRDDLVRKDALPQAESVKISEEPSCDDKPNGIDTTETELAVYEYVVRRLAFLIQDESLFGRLSDVQWTDYKTCFCVYYKNVRKGRLFIMREGSDPKYHFEFALEGNVLDTNDLSAIDAYLISNFTKRVEDLG